MSAFLAVVAITGGLVVIAWIAIDSIQKKTANVLQWELSNGNQMDAALGKLSQC